MTDAEEDRIIGADFKVKRAAERRLSCLESKRAAVLENIELTSRAFDAEVVIDSVDGNTLRTMTGRRSRDNTPPLSVRPPKTYSAW